LFVGYEIRQNTNAVKAEAIQEYNNSQREHVALYINDPEMTRIIGKAITDDESLSQDEYQRYWGFALAGTYSTQAAFRQWQLGVLPDEEWSIELYMTCKDRQIPSLQGLIDAQRPYLIPSFVEAIESGCSQDQAN